jgi:acetyl-CoA carboxylase biotin carboxyl carrier protein
MDTKEIQELIRFVAKSGVSEVELETKGFKIVIKTGNSKQEVQRVVEYQAAPVAATPVSAPAPSPAAPAVTSAAPAPKAEDTSKYVEIKSPMIGTFYRKPSPDKNPFVNVGDEIKKGTVLCVIEAMKLFNEIESEISGKIVKVLVDDSSPVEYDQPLFLVDPS